MFERWKMKNPFAISNPAEAYRDGAYKDQNPLISNLNISTFSQQFYKKLSVTTCFLLVGNDDDQV